jgi:hypothetical protein
MLEEHCSQLGNHVGEKNNSNINVPFLIVMTSCLTNEPFVLSRKTHCDKHLSRKYSYVKRLLKLSDLNNFAIQNLWKFIHEFL